MGGAAASALMGGRAGWAMKVDSVPSTRTPRPAGAILTGVLHGLLAQAGAGAVGGASS